MIEGLWSAFAAPGSKPYVPPAVRICRRYVAGAFGVDPVDPAHGPACGKSKSGS